MIAEHPDIKKWQYLYIVNEPDNIVSVFDDLRYDRSDADMLSPAMRRHVIDKLEKIGFKQKTGSVLENNEKDVRCIIPKFHALGSSPFDITRYTTKRTQDYFILTPTQTACQYVNAYELDQAVDRILHLVEKQPINIYKLLDYLEHTETHKKFFNAIAYIRDIQKEMINSEPLLSRHSLG